MPLRLRPALLHLGVERGANDDSIIEKRPINIAVDGMARGARSSVGGSCCCQPVVADMTAHIEREDCYQSQHVAVVGEDLDGAPLRLADDLNY
jgi:hypothetical protein